MVTLDTNVCNCNHICVIVNSVTFGDEQQMFIFPPYLTTVFAINTIWMTQ